MTEAEWLSSDNPAAMLHWLDPYNARVGKVTDPDTSHLWTARKLRLFVEACRERWSPNICGAGESRWLERAQEWTIRQSFASQYAVPEIMATLLRLIFGNPFRPVEFPDHLGWCCGKYWHVDYCGTCKREMERPCWLTPDVLAIAQTIYENRDASGFGPLWDALEDAGCTNEEIRRALAWEQRCGKCLGTKLRHPLNDPKYAKWSCTSFNDGCWSGWLPMPGEPYFVRGMWVVDLLLGKE